ncbi:MAG: phosphatase PAP2 family protein [Acidobacteria bacterium]|nr:phosphatase PAP2 family protein [Acidobacteriota bacterium]
MRRAYALQATALLTFLFLASGATSLEVPSWDLRAARQIRSWDWPGVAQVMKLVSLAGNLPYGPTLAFGAAALALLLLRRRREAAFLGLSGGGGYLLSGLLKWWIGRPRPPGDVSKVFVSFDGGSFPSGHVMHFTTFYGFLAVLVALHLRGWKRGLLLSILLALILAVGFSRIYLGAHWPSDVLGAYSLGVAWLLLVSQWYRKAGEG